MSRRLINWPASMNSFYGLLPVSSTSHKNLKPDGSLRTMNVGQDSIPSMNGNVTLKIKYKNFHRFKRLARDVSNYNLSPAVGTVNNYSQ